MASRTIAWVSVAAGALPLVLGGPTAPAVAAAPARGAQIRVDQGGYLTDETKPARLMARAPVARGTTYQVRNEDGDVVLTGTVPTKPTGRWSKRYPAIYRLDVSGLHSAGRYRITVGGAVDARSPWFPVTADPAEVYRPLVTAGTTFFQTQRDGADVIPGALDRQPSHLLDRRAKVYRWPRMERGSDLILDRRLHRIGGPIDVEGGWFDAGDYVKFVHTTAYADVILFTSADLLGDQAPVELESEARFGLRWLSKMWQPRTKALYFQVGIGSGNRAGTFVGDHDVWRLPEADDADTSHLDRFMTHRPVFRAAAPGKRISPNLIGRMSAAFALAARADATSHPARARRELRTARQLYARAAIKHPPRPLVTALPHAFYPESSWRDDMELGAAAIARAAQSLDQPAAPYLRDAARFAHDFIAQRDPDTLNLYNTSALAHLMLAHAMREVPHGRLATTRTALVRDLARQIKIGRAHARHDAFGAGAPPDEYDVNSHSFALIATVAFYDQLTHSQRFQPFASQVRTWLLGGDPWGVTAMVGIGQRFPLCMQHQVANLSGSTDGSPPIAVGAVVNGPNGASEFDRHLGGFQDGMRHCTTKGRHLPRYDGQGSRYLDDVRVWQTNEPALDMTGAAILAGAAQLAVR